MIFSKPALVPNEQVLYRKGANFVASLNESELDRFFADELMWLVGMQGKEAIGGHLYITNYRIIFVAHAFNRLKGQFSIPLNCITGTERKVKFPIYKLVVLTDHGKYEFVCWHSRSAMKIIEENKENFSSEIESQMIDSLEKNMPLCFVNSMFIPKDVLKARWNKMMSD